MKAFIVAIIVLCAQLCIAQETGDIEKMILRGKEDLQKAVDANDIDQLMASRSYFLELLGSNKHEEVIYYYIGYADLNLFGNYYYVKKEKKKAKKYVYEGIEQLEKAVELKDDFAEGYALLSWLYFQKIEVKRISMMRSGKKSHQFMNKALKLAPENPRVLLYAGLVRYQTPKVAGGSKEEGLKSLQKSVDSFKTFKPQKPYYPAHGLEVAYAYLGIFHMEQNNLNEAQKCFNKVLDMNPENSMVKDSIARLDEMKRR